MGRHIGRGLLRFLALTAFLHAAPAPLLAARSAFAPDALTPPRKSYPSYDEILPLWMSLLRIKEASVYRVGPPKDLRLLDQGRDSVGIIAGCPVLDSARVGSEGGWLDSLRAIVGSPTSYRQEQQMQLVPPEYVIRLRGDEDSMTVTTGAGGSFLYVTPSSGNGIAGWIDRDRGKLAALIQTALRPPKPQANHSRRTKKVPPAAK